MSNASTQPRFHAHQSRDGRAARAGVSRGDASATSTRPSPPAIEAFDADARPPAALAGRSARRDRRADHGRSATRCSSAARAETALPRAAAHRRARPHRRARLKMFAGDRARGVVGRRGDRHGRPEPQPLPKPDLRRMLRPRGPVAVFGASNFPFAFGTLGGDTASALAAGCPVVVKGHPSHPGHVAAVRRRGARRDREAQAARRAVRAAPGPAPRAQRRAGEASGHHRRRLHRLAQGRPRAVRPRRRAADARFPVFAEMGSVNPVVVMPGALAEKADDDREGPGRVGPARRRAVLHQAGRVFTVGDDATFVDAARRSTSAQPPGHDAQRATCARTSSARSAMSPRCTASNALATAQPTGHAGISPSLFATDADTFRREHALQEEAFGPGGVVVHCKTSTTPSPASTRSTATSPARSTSAAQRRPTPPQSSASSKQKVGRVIVNGYPTGVEVNHAIVHGGPYPATTDPATTSVGSAAIRRWVRMIA